MNHSFIKGFLLLCIIWIPLQNIKSQNLSSGNETVWIMSYNIRYAGNSPEEIKFWDQRKENIVFQIKIQDAGIIGIQEVLQVQLEDLTFLLPDFAWIGKARDDGEKKGEYCPVFYNKNKFRMLSSGTFWLSETPGIPSKGWDAALNRIATYAKLQIINTGSIFYFFNTHFDHVGIEARKYSAELIIKQINDIAEGYSVVLTGDFNDTSGSSTYKTITSQLIDSKLVSLTGHRGPEFSFNGFNTNIEEGDRIDYIFVSSGIEVLNHRIMNDKFEGHYPPDHFPLAAEIRVK